MVAGIPDLRLTYGDPYLSRDEDLAQARALAALAPTMGFAELLAEHWRMNGKPPELAERFLRRDLETGSRSAGYLGQVERYRGRPLGPEDAVLEIGCGTAGLAGAAAARSSCVVATDISMRWLVLAQKRLAEAGVAGPRLVCCAAERPPFPPATFDLIAASDVIEHTTAQPELVGAAGRLLRAGGTLFLVTPNRFSLALEPHVRLWGVGYLPLALARRYVRRMRDAPYEHVFLLSARGLDRLCRAAGLRASIVTPEIPPVTQALYRGPELRLVRAYNRARRLGPVRRLLLLVGPFFHVFATQEVE